MMNRIRNLAEVAVVHSTDTVQANVCAKQVHTHIVRQCRFNEQTRAARCNETNTGNRMIGEGSKTSLHDKGAYV